MPKLAAVAQMAAQMVPALRLQKRQVGAGVLLPGRITRSAGGLGASGPIKHTGHLRVGARASKSV